ncbi:beta,beta-carotene 15,15'-dioxygenase-like [Lepeophtheirus salmonis]|uniref:beta,beta-carotene 15,15'-dioxygenase-like n=2 Tax=Lepeophtheirus salmonis TaxID=72036 RepID=UPI001AE1CC6E|nr:beta,beta-carotene 15,15'-dioxygenase-like [Lepeophtheirus salmonis]
MNREMSDKFMEMKGSFRGQSLPEWFINIMSGRSSSTYDMKPFGTQSMMRMDDQGDFMARFMRPERETNTNQGSQNYSYHEKNTESNSSIVRHERFDDQQGHGYFPFYRFGNRSPSSNNRDMSQFIRIQTGFPLRDLNGDYFNMGASFSNGNNYHFVKYQDSFEMNNYQVIGSVPSRFPNHIGLFHAYGMTDNYLVFCEQPCGFDVRHFGNSQRFSGDYGMEYMRGESNYFYIMNKRTGRRMEVSYVTDKPYFFYNFVNCYEYENHVVIDVMGFEDSDFFSSMRSSSSQFFREKYSSSKIMRFRLPLNAYSRGMELTYSSSSYRDSSMLSHGCNRIILRPQYLFRESELMYPCINPNYNCKKYQYTYGNSGNSIIKFDVENGQTLMWRGENEFWRPFRSMFVPNPSGRYEDDGVLISWCSHSRGDFSKSFMIFIDAHSMKELSRTHFDSPFPMGSSESFYSPYLM